MHPEQPRARRYLFTANVEVIDVDSEYRVKGQTRDLNPYGCQIACGSPPPVGTRVRLKITYKGSAFTSLGYVARANQGAMGVAFGHTEEKDKSVLESWLAELRRTSSPSTMRPEQSRL